MPSKFSFALENEFDIVIPDDDVRKVRNVRQMCEGVEDWSPLRRPARPSVTHATGRYHWSGRDLRVGADRTRGRGKPCGRAARALARGIHRMSQMRFRNGAEVRGYHASTLLLTTGARILWTALRSSRDCRARQPWPMRASSGRRNCARQRLSSQAHAWAARAPRISVSRAL